MEPSNRVTTNTWCFPTVAVCLITHFVFSQIQHQSVLKCVNDGCWPKKTDWSLFLNIAQKESGDFWFFYKGSEIAGCCIIVFSTTALRSPSDSKSTHFQLEGELIVLALWYLWPPHGLQPPQSKQKQVQLRPGSTIERHFAVGAAAVLYIAPRAPSPGWFDQVEEIIKPVHGRAQLSPNSLRARGWRGSRPLLDTSCKSIAPGLISGTASVPGQPQHCTPFWLPGQ